MRLGIAPRSAVFTSRGSRNAAAAFWKTLSKFVPERFNPEGGHERHEYAFACSAERPSVSIADRGPGIPQEQRDRVFERFWRGKGTDSTGSGLGLAIVAEIMKAHHGRISATAVRRPGC